jgi:RNA polymerase sigma factor (sigma-70 family)
MTASNFFAELKQRNVYKVGIAYAVAAWLLMQVASQIFPFFEIPNWAVRLVVLLLIIGFPVALILAWAFDLTPEGIKRAEDVCLGTSIAQKSRNLTAILRGRRKQAMPFTITDWSAVLEAQGPTPAAQAAVDKLCRTYWRPIYGFARRQGVQPQEAKDLTQGFFALLLERRDLDTVRKGKGRLRSYLLTSLKRCLTNERNRAMAIKRGEGQRLIPLPDFRERERAGFEPMDTASADHIYERDWALTVLNQVLARLGDEYRAAGPASAGLFDRLQKSLTDKPDSPSLADTGREFGMTENAVKQTLHRLRQRYRQLLREEIAHTVMVSGDIEDELRHLIAVLRAYPIRSRSHAVDNFYEQPT